MAEYADEAHRIVDAAIENACRRLAEESGLQNNEPNGDLRYNEDDIRVAKEGKDEYLDKLGKIDSKTFAEIPNIAWMNIGDFTVDGGLNKIEKFIETWKRDTSWLHCIDFLKEEDFPYSKRYRYEVKWSIPTRRKPIPRATASTYFTLDVNKVRPKNYPIEVYYVFEGHQLVHRPGKSRFNEKWLKSIIESKVRLMQSITF
ncbi:A-kinase anchor protein 14-like [Dendronephthya gigantea]|uniref:A-kinase anchor protein 14-like n=1 Tax=Dendronephthya gigantea TaxID=151771 RepID=UPI0010698C4E|nr:A-kinase anchor protein 14-like [Dendronephthya gigantea]